MNSSTRPGTGDETRYGTRLTAKKTSTVAQKAALAATAPALAIPPIPSPIFDSKIVALAPSLSP